MTMRCLEVEESQPAPAGQAALCSLGKFHPFRPEKGGRGGRKGINNYNRRRVYISQKRAIICSGRQ